MPSPKMSSHPAPAACGAASDGFKRSAPWARALAAVAVVAGSAGAPTSVAAEETFTLVAFGDSLIAGYGLPVADGFVPALQAWLAENGVENVAVVNAGVSGDTTSGGLARLDWSIGPEADAVLLELGANDALRGVDPAIARANLDAMLVRLAERDLPVLLAGMGAPRNWGPDYVAAFEAMYPDLAESHGVPLYPFFLQAVFSGEGERDPSLWQDDGLHPSAKGAALIAADIGPAIAELIAAARADAAPDS